MAHRNVRTRTPRMNRFWIELTNAANGVHSIGLSVVMTNDGQGTVIFTSATSLPQDRDVTIARMFLPYACEVIGATPANVAMGLAVVDPAAGSGDLNAITDAGWDGWMMHQWLFLAGSTSTIPKPTPVSSDPKRELFGTGQTTSGTLDIKSKRKIPQGSILMVSLAIEAVSAANNDEAHLAFGGRVLLMER